MVEKGTGGGDPGVDRLDFERAAENTKKDWLTSLPFKGRLTVSVNLSAW